MWLLVHVIHVLGGFVKSLTQIEVRVVVQYGERRRGPRDGEGRPLSPHAEGMNEGALTTLLHTPALDDRLGRTRNEPGEPCYPYPGPIASGEKTHTASQALKLKRSPHHIRQGSCHITRVRIRTKWSAADHTSIARANTSAMALVCRRLPSTALLYTLNNGSFSLPQTSRQRCPCPCRHPSSILSCLPQTL
jgi:hypothetical protein